MMALKAKIPIVDRRIAFSPGGVFSDETIAREFARMASEDIAQVDRENAFAAGHKLPMTTMVDGVEKAPLPASVDLDSTITARWEIGVAAVDYAWTLLQSAGPMKTGAYRKSHRLYADGREVEAPEETIGAREVMILSIVPYARKIERGKGGYAPGAIYQAVAAMAAARYSNAARIKYTHAEPPGAAGPLDAWARSHAAQAGSARKQRAQLAKDRRQPAIIFYLT